MQDKILLFVPMYNCARQIARLISQFRNPAVEKLIAGILLVDDGSTDSTRDIAAHELEKISVPVRVLLQNDESYGPGGSCKVAFQFALERGYTHIIVLRSDGWGNIEDILPHIKDGIPADMDGLLGARFMSGARLEGYPLQRRVVDCVFRFLFSAFARRWLYDLNPRLSLFRTALFEDTFYQTYVDDLIFNAFLVFGLCQRACRLNFFPIAWRETELISDTHLFRYGFYMLKILVGYLSGGAFYLAMEHRENPRLSYPYTVLKAWGINLEEVHD